MTAQCLQGREQMPLGVVVVVVAAVDVVVVAVVVDVDAGFHHLNSFLENSEG